MSAQPDVIPPPSRALRSKDFAFRLALWACLAIAIGLLVVLLVDVAIDGAGTLSWDFINNFTSITADKAGIQAGLWGTIWLMGVCALFIVPVGVATAIYLEEYADPSRWWNRLIELNIQNLAAVPSIVYGILGLGLIARGPLGLGFTVLTAALTLSLLVLPIVIIASREAIRAVPSSIRAGSLALGATKWQTVRRQVLPAAIPGIATGSILALSRAIGEAAPLLMIGAAGFVRFNPDSLSSAFTALPIQIYNWAKEPQAEYTTLAWAAVIILLLILLLMNSVAIVLRNRYQKRW